MSSIHYRERGAGQTVLLIHGFPMNHHVWDEFADKLSQSFRVITPDLPGFGESALLPKGFSLEDVAAAMLNWTRTENISEPVVVGHSLGGYVALAMAEQAQERMAGLCLFHSTALPDSEEKKQSRNKVLEFIETHGVEAFTSNFISQLYFDPEHPSAGYVRGIATQASPKTVEGYTLAMRDRPDRTSVLKHFLRPLLLITGEKDPGIPVDTIMRQGTLNPGAEVFVLPDTGHLGMFESEEACLKKIREFSEKSRVTF